MEDERSVATAMPSHQPHRGDGAWPLRNRANGWVSLEDGA
jgi:hypothetical protein